MIFKLGEPTTFEFEMQVTGTVSGVPVGHFTIKNPESVAISIPANQKSAGVWEVTVPPLDRYLDVGTYPCEIAIVIGGHHFVPIVNTCEVRENDKPVVSGAKITSDFDDLAAPSVTVQVMEPGTEKPQEKKDEMRAEEKAPTIKAPINLPEEKPKVIEVQPEPVKFEPLIETSVGAKSEEKSIPEAPLKTEEPPRETPEEKLRRIFGLPEEKQHETRKLEEKRKLEAKLLEEKRKLEAKLAERKKLEEKRLEEKKPGSFAAYVGAKRAVRPVEEKKKQEVDALLGQMLKKFH